MWRHRMMPKDPEPYRLPQPPAPVPTAGTFMVCPLGALQGLTGEQLRWMQTLYQLALEQAQAVVRPSLPERDLLGVWN
jgi:hypothetical protein